MKKLLLYFSLLFFSFGANAQITGSDTVCAGYIYTYSVNMPGAVSFNWSLPTGWYIISGQGTSTVVADCNVNVGQICVTGYDGIGTVINSVCHSVSWGGGGQGWFVNGTSHCGDPCCTHHYFILEIDPQGPSCSGGCGTGFPNPNVILAAFDNPWPTGNYLGQVNNSTPFPCGNGISGYTVYVYSVDTTFGITNMILVQGSAGCGIVNNTFYIPDDPIYQPVIVPLILTPDPVCVGDTFVISMDSFYSSNINLFSWSVFTGNISLIGPTNDISITGVLTAAGFSEIYFTGSDWTGCYGSNGDIIINYAICNVPLISFSSSLDSVCPGKCISFTNTSLNATTYQWFFPGATPDTSTSLNPSNICYADSGSYDVILIASNNYGSDTIVYTNYIHVYGVPPSFTIFQSGDTLWAPPGFAGYQWILNNTNIAGADSFYCVVAQSGNYSLLVTDANGCQNFAQVINVQVGVANFSLQEDSRFWVYPNPAKDFLAVKLLGTTEDKMDLFLADIVGQKIYHESLKPISAGLEIKIDLKNFPTGIYLLGVSDGKNTQMKKITILR